MHTARRGDRSLEHGRCRRTTSSWPSTAVADVAPEQVGFSGRKTAEVVGISYRQLDYWARTDLVRPSLAEARGSGSRRLYSYRDLLELKVIKTLLDAGLKLESVRQVFSYMREQLGEDISSANLVISGSHLGAGPFRARS